jgi:hypothetical protein
MRTLYLGFALLSLVGCDRGQPPQQPLLGQQPLVEHRTDNARYPKAELIAPTASPAISLAVPPAGSPPVPPAVQPSAAAPQQSAPLAAVVLAYNRMTYVMDSPLGQQEKALKALERSALVGRLRKLGFTVTYRFDPNTEHEIVAYAPDGTELGRAELIEVDSQTVPEALVQRITDRKP